MKSRNLLVLGILGVVLSACGRETIPDPDVQTEVPPTGSDGMSQQGGMDDGGFGEGEFFEEEDGLTMVIYFDFDKSEVRPEYVDALGRHAARLANDSRASVRLEGHADERGSREYNIGLGERRSQSVRRMLLIQGASSDQVSTVSFGEERPVAFGSDEASYQQNRRVEIRYLN